MSFLSDAQKNLLVKQTNSTSLLKSQQNRVLGGQASPARASEIGIPEVGKNAVKKYLNDPKWGSVAKAFLEEDESSPAYMAYMTSNASTRVLPDDLAKYIGDYKAQKLYKQASTNEKVGKFTTKAMNAVDSASMGFLKSDSDVYNEAKDRLSEQYPGSAKVGQFGGVLMGGAATYVPAKLGVMTVKAGIKKLAKAAGEDIAEEAAEAASKSIIKRAGESAAIGGIDNALYGLGYGINEGKDGKTLAKEALINLGLGAFLVGGVTAVMAKKAASTAAKTAKSAAKEVVEEAAPLVGTSTEKANKVDFYGTESGQIIDRPVSGYLPEGQPSNGFTKIGEQQTGSKLLDDTVPSQNRLANLADEIQNKAKVANASFPDQLAREVEDAKAIVDKAIQDNYDYIINYKGKGAFWDVNPVYGSSYGGYAGGQRISNNNQWYQDFLKERGHKPTKAEAMDLAKKWVVGLEDEFADPEVESAVDRLIELDALKNDGNIIRAEGGRENPVSLIYGQEGSAVEKIVDDTRAPYKANEMSVDPAAAEEALINRRTGTKVTQKTRNVLDRLDNGKDVPLEEINDLPEIREAKIASMQAGEETYKINTPERIAMRQEAKEWGAARGSYSGVDNTGKDVYNGIVNRGRRIDFVIGLPGSGKTSRFVNPLSEKNGSRVVDPDDFNRFFPEDSGGVGANAVHKESSNVKNEVLSQAMDNGENIVLPTIGSDLEKTIKQIEGFKKEGYSVYVHLNEIPNGKAVSRVLQRYFKEGRFVDPGLVKSFGDGPTEVYNALRAKGGYLDGYTRASNDVAQGAPLEIFESTEGIFNAGKLRPVQQIPSGRGLDNSNVGGTRPKARAAEQSNQITQTGAGGEPALFMPGAERRSLASNSIPKAIDAEVEGMAKVYDELSPEAQTYTPEAMEATQAKAQQYVANSGGVEAAFTNLNNKMQRGESLTSIESASIVEMIKHYAKNAAAGSIEKAVALTEGLMKTATDMGRAINALKLLQKNSPEGFLKMATAQVKKLNETGKIKVELTGQDQADLIILGQIAQKGGRQGVDIGGASTSLYKWLMKAETVKNLDWGNAATGKALSVIANKQPSSFVQKFRSLQRISMLSNPKTHVRNVGGNAIMTAGSLASKPFAAIADKLLSMKTGQKTVANISPAHYLRGIGEGTQKAINDGKLGLDTGSKYTEGEVFHPKAFNPDLAKNKLQKGTYAILDKLDQGISTVLNMGDSPFYMGQYRSVLAQLQKANKAGSATAEMIETAMNSAERATFRDNNAITNAFQSVRNALDFGGKVPIGSTIAPFVRTPVNVIKVGLEYSPIGTVEAIGKTFFGKNSMRALLARGESTMALQRDVAELFGRGIVGSGLMLLGLGIAAAGRATGSDEDATRRQQALNKTTGDYPNTIQIGDKHVDMSSLQLASTPLLAGAAVGQNDFKLSDFLQAAVNMGNTALEMPVIQGVQQLLGGSYDDTSVVEGVLGLIGDAGAQVIPFGSLGRQIANATDDVSRDRRADGEGVAGLAEDALNQMSARIPGKADNFPSRYDVLGRESESYKSDSAAGRLANIFLNPVNVYPDTSTPVTNEVNRLYKESKDSGVFPKTAPYNTSYDNNAYDLTAAQQQEWQKTEGQAANKNLSEIIKSDEYKNASTADKVKMFEYVLTHSYETAKDKFLTDQGQDYEPGGVTEGLDKAQKQGVPTSVFLLTWSKRSQLSTSKVADGEKREIKEPLKEYISQLDVSLDQMVWLLENSGSGSKANNEDIRFFKRAIANR